MKKVIVTLLSILLCFFAISPSPIFADVATTSCATIPTAECDECETDDCGEEEDCNACYNGWYCGISYATVGLGIAAIAAVTAIILASGSSETAH